MHHLVSKNLQRLLLLTILLLATSCATTQPGTVQESETAQKPVTATDATSQEEKVLYAWVQQGAGTEASARAIVPAAQACPELLIDGTPARMTSRGPSPKAFREISVCEYPLSSTTPVSSLRVGDFDLPSATQNSDRIAVLGDTGCRKKRKDQQDCDGDPAQGAWGFPSIAAQINATAPDLILHIGDYLYRESGCKDCGFKWSTWEADFFEPTRESGLLTAAPWILVRGNHEDCKRAWRGYFLFFGQEAVSTTCGDEAPFAVELTDLDLYVTDTSSKDTDLAQKDYTKIAQELQGATKDAWIATHVPICKSYECPEEMGTAFTASGLSQADALKWMHVAHIHYFLHIDATPGKYPEQSINGGGGTEMYECPAPAAQEFCYGGGGAYSFLMVETKETAWQATLYGLDGEIHKEFSVDR